MSKCYLQARHTTIGADFRYVMNLVGQARIDKGGKGGGEGVSHRSLDPVSNTCKSGVLVCNFEDIERDCCILNPKRRDPVSDHFGIEMQQSRSTLSSVSAKECKNGKIPKISCQSVQYDELYYLLSF